MFVLADELLVALHERRTRGGELRVRRLAGGRVRSVPFRSHTTIERRPLTPLVSVSSFVHATKI